MNAVEIEEAVSKLAEQPFDPESFPYAFLEAFGNKPATLQRLKSGATNQSDLGGVLQRGNIHLKVCAPGEVAETLGLLRESKKTATQKAKFILATDGIELQAEALEGEGETLACDYPKFADHFGFFLPLAGISTVRQIRENAFDIKATGRLNRLYIELLKDNPEWATAARREDLNHFMARLIFCFFAEDTNIFHSESLFTATVEQMSARDSSNTHEVISELFRAMNTKLADRGKARIKSWANLFPYVNGGLFSDSVDVPRFSKIARSYLLHVGNLDWTKINPDIFGSMIQAVADDEERGALGMHYTSVPNILKVLNPLFLDDLREKLEDGGNNPRKLLNLRNRIARIRVFDPACGSGNFLVIAYKELRAIEAEINRRRGEAEIKSAIPLTNFRGIEIRHFSCEIARLALIIAEYQCDVLYRGQQLALAEFLPLEAANWITCGNALRLDWLSICPPTGKGVKNRGDDLFPEIRDQAEIDFANEGSEIYICGNPPYVWSNDQSPSQKEELGALFSSELSSWKTLNYISGWFLKAADYIAVNAAKCAIVSTNTVCQGQNVSLLWPVLFGKGCEICFAHTSFKWSNLASRNAGVTVVIVGLRNKTTGNKRLFWEEADGSQGVRTVENINAYLIPGIDVIVRKHSSPLSEVPEMKFGNKPVDGGNLIMTRDEMSELRLSGLNTQFLVRKIFGASEVIDGACKYCLWISDNHLAEAVAIPAVRQRIERVAAMRKTSSDFGDKSKNHRPHQFREMRHGSSHTIALPSVSSESRDYLPATVLDSRSVISNRNYGIYDGPFWTLAILVSRIHWVWAGTVCGRLELRFSYTNALGWNAFPLSPLTEQNKADLTRCAEDILLARETHFPATIADLYNPEKMPADLRAAHERNDETLERIYIGRRFKNFGLYTKMTANAPAKKAAKKAAKKGTGRRKA
jgi:hypothetical protein